MSDYKYMDEFDTREIDALYKECDQLRQALKAARSELTGRSIGFEMEAIDNAVTILDNALKGGGE